MFPDTTLFLVLVKNECYFLQALQSCFSYRDALAHAPLKALAAEENAVSPKLKRCFLFIFLFATFLLECSA